MTSKRQRTTGSQRSCPNSTQRIKSRSSNEYNPEFDQLSSKKLTLPCTIKHETHTLTPDYVRQLLLQTLAVHFEERFIKFYELCEKWIVGEWKQTRLNMQSRLSKISYLSPTLAFDTFSNVEKQVRLEWRKNHLLKGVTYIWAHSFRKHHFATLAQARQFYDAFCQTFTTVTYALFQHCFMSMEQKGTDVKAKILRNTAVTVVTELKQWREIYTSKLEPFFLNNSPSFSENFNIGSIQLNTRILDVHTKRNAFFKTKTIIESMMSCLTMDEATAHLMSFRSSLQKQMRESIEQEEGKQSGKYPTVEKDDVLGCIIFTLVRYKLDNVGCFLGYLSFLLGRDIDTVLRNRKVDCFRADLEAAYEYASHQVVKIDFSQPQTSA